MLMPNSISGFSKLSKSKKIDWIADSYFVDKELSKQILKQYWHSNPELQQLHDEFIENTITNYYLPLGVAPNFLINDTLYTLPMAIEESSVVAAASKAAKFWLDRGGFKAEVISTTKIGHVHFMYYGDIKILQQYFNAIKPQLINAVKPITKNMNRRGGGVTDITLINKTKALEGYYQLKVRFETLDAMGANFINSCLEQFAQTFRDSAKQYKMFTDGNADIKIVMSILSNYVPECLVKAEVSCPVAHLNEDKTVSPTQFAETFLQAVKIAEIEPYRAVTHNKGIMNGIDAVVLATGNDFRAIEACAHAYASRHGTYSSLTHTSVEGGIFKFWIEIPLALGTVGGLTKLHPLVKLCMEMLQNPSARDLMQIVAVSGLAQNFAALRSLTTTGIQEGHMKMHLMNILNQNNASAAEKTSLIKHFKTNTVSHNAVIEALNRIRTTS